MHNFKELNQNIAGTQWLSKQKLHGRGYGPPYL
jgi:hypothetical protein